MWGPEEEQALLDSIDHWVEKSVAPIAREYDLADKYPEKLKELKDIFYAEARKYNVLPLQDSRLERLNPAIRPSLTRGRDTFTYYPGMTRIPRGASPDVLNRSWSIEADVVIPKGGAEGLKKAIDELWGVTIPI